MCAHRSSYPFDCLTLKTHLVYIFLEETCYTCFVSNTSFILSILVEIHNLKIGEPTLDSLHKLIHKESNVI